MGTRWSTESSIPEKRRMRLDHQRAKSTIRSPVQSRGFIIRARTLPSVVTTTTNTLLISPRNARTRRMVSSARGFPVDILRPSEPVHAVVRPVWIHLAVALGVRGQRNELLPGGPGHLFRLLFRHLRRPGGAADQNPDGSRARA